MYNYCSTVFKLTECYPLGRNPAFPAKIRLILEINPSQRVKDAVGYRTAAIFAAATTWLCMRQNA